MKRKFIKLSLALALILPAAAFAASSDLKNQSDAKTGYYLVQDKIISEHGCVLAPTAGNKKINPGDAATLKVKDSCKWGVVTYDMYSIGDNKKIGTLAHSYRDGTFMIGMEISCKGSACNFTGLNLQQ